MTSELDDLERELAEIERDGRSAEAGGGRRKGLGLLPVLVAVLGVSGVGAVVYYAYNSGVREGSEVAAPLLTPDGPVKVKPDDPGGLVVPHRDKSVFAVVQQGGAPTDEKVETLLPPPEDPMRPPAPQVASATDQAAIDPDAEAALGAQSGAEPPPIPSITETPPDRPVTPRPPKLMEPVLPAAGLQAPSAPPTLDAATPAEAAAQPEAPQEPQPETPPAQAESTISAPPERSSAQTAPAPSAPPQNTQVAGVDLSSAWRIQIGALRSQEAAEREWARQSDRHKDLLGALSLQVQRVTIEGKGEFFRVRGGPLPNKATADDLCAQLSAKNLSCLSVRPGA